MHINLTKLNKILNSPSLASKIKQRYSFLSNSFVHIFRFITTDETVDRSGTTTALL